MFKQGDVAFDEGRGDFVYIKCDETRRSADIYGIRLRGAVIWRCHKDLITRAAMTFGGPCRV